MQRGLTKFFCQKDLTDSDEGQNSERKNAISKEAFIDCEGVLEMGQSPTSFSLFTSFQHLAVEIFAEYWIRTAKLWYWKQPL